MGPVTGVEVAIVSDGDVPACVEVISIAFGHDAPFFDIYFPDHDTPAGRAQACKRLTAWKQGSESSTFLKAVTRPCDEGQEHIIGLAVWTLMKEAPPAELSKAEDVEDVWPDAGDREFMTRLWREYVIPRTQAINASGGKGVYVLELLGVHPDDQRLGAGRALVEWGTRAADEQGVKVRISLILLPYLIHDSSQTRGMATPINSSGWLLNLDRQAVVEGTPIGQKLYEQCGLTVEIEEMRFDVGEEFIGRRLPKLVFLTREPRT